MNHNHRTGAPLPPAYQVRDRELPQRLLGILLWVALLAVLWIAGGPG
jgi:hypothetical protein